jgi:hypothetical protein
MLSYNYNWRRSVYVKQNNDKREYLERQFYFLLLSADNNIRFLAAAFNSSCRSLLLN